MIVTLPFSGIGSGTYSEIFFETLSAFGLFVSGLPLIVTAVALMFGGMTVSFGNLITIWSSPIESLPEPPVLNVIVYWASTATTTGSGVTLAGETVEAWMS